MSRPLRIQVAHQVYHTISRCVARAYFLAEEADFRMLVNCIRRAKARYPVSVYGYCFMSNHYHLLVQPQLDDILESFMQYVNGRYASWYNATHGRQGHFWQGRYHSVLIQGDYHSLTCLRYIERNPIRAGLVISPVEYKWSSCRYYTLGEPDPLLVSLPSYLGLASDPNRRQPIYRKIVEGALLADGLGRRRDLSDGIAFGDPEFLRQFPARRRPGRPRASEPKR